MNPSHGKQRTPEALIVSLLLKLLRLGWLYCCLGVLYALAEGPRYVPRVLVPMTVLGVPLCCVFELRNPSFPFWLAMQLPIGAGVLLAIHRSFTAAASERRE